MRLGFDGTSKLVEPVDWRTGGRNWGFDSYYLMRIMSILDWRWVWGCMGRRFLFLESTALSN